MKTKWNFLMVLVLLATLLGGTAIPAQAQGGITGISPAEGTVGTQVTITGTGFGDKQGEVLLGEAKCRVLAWSDTEITFLVDKPQRPGEYTVTVLLQGDKKSAEPLTFGAFAMRRPRITPGALIQDGITATVVGDFFGDKQGVLRVGYQAGGELANEAPKILDWSMNTIRFELPEGLTGAFVLAVRSEVGTGLALMDLLGGLVGQVNPIPDWGGSESWENANGVYYFGGSTTGSLYYFYSRYNPGYSDNWAIRARIIHDDWNSDSISPPQGEAEVPLQPLVVKDTTGKETLWVFHTGHMWSQNACCTKVWYAKYYDNGIWGEWDPAGWQSVPNVDIDERVTLAPVYDPRNHRISVYFDRNNQLRWFYSDDFGKTWSDDVLVAADVGGVTVINSFVHAIYWPSDTTTALVASTGQVIAVDNGEYRGSIGHLTDDFWRPSLVDLGGETALLYMNHAGGHNTPEMRKLNYKTWSWSEPTTLVTLPDTGIPLSQYGFTWSPRGVVSSRPGTDRHLYVFYGVHFAQEWSCTDINEHSIDCSGASDDRWYLHDEAILGPVVDTPPIGPTDFSQVSAGEQHACAIKPDGTVECWGSNQYGQATRPTGTFVQVSAGNWTTCGVKTDHTIACWGINDYNLVSNSPSGNNFTQVSVGLQVACGLKADNTVKCWGNSGSGITTPQTGMTQISAGQWHTCGIKTDGSVYCWGDDGGAGRTKPPTDKKFTQISAAAWHTCGVTSDGSVVCWGDNDANRVTPVTPLAAGLTYKEVSAGNWHTCALVSDGTIRCWGSDGDKRVSSTPDNDNFTHIEAGIRNTCALRADGGITCWGTNTSRQSLPPF